MKWRIADTLEGLKDFLWENDVVKDVREVEIIFDEGLPTAVSIKLKSGEFLNFTTLGMDPDGFHERLSVSTTKEIE